MVEERVEGAVTVLFTDVEGSTDMRTRLGDEAADELLRLHEEIVRERVSKHDGREIKALGDGYMVAFSSPRKAISCAVEIQRALEDRNRSDPGRELRIRIGINAGEVTEKAGDLFGAAVNAAARIAQKAHGGQILVANVVKDLAGIRPDLSYMDRGLFWLKGFPERWRLYEVLRGGTAPVSEITVPTMQKTEFVGRDAERADLRRLIEGAVGGHGAMVMIGGEPGVGKTRITEELAEEAAGHRMMTMVGHCAETEAAPPYAPVVELFDATFRGVSKKTLREALGDAAPEIARIMPELRRVFPDLPAPIELPPEQERRYLFNSITDFLMRASHMQPLLLVLEDLHWADEPSLLLLRHLAERVAELPILLIGTYRDVELDVDRPLARTLEELVRRRLVHRIALSRLPKEGVATMLRVLAAREPPASLVEAVYAETEGNCFFVEEVFQHLLEEGKLFDQTGEWRTEVRIGEVDVPEGVRLVLGRRLARLSEGARRALGGAAVIGRNFTFELVEALGEVSTDALLDGIEEAHRARLLSSSEDAFQARFTFAHELIRQTLLTGLSLPRRQRLHLRVAEAIERVHARELDSHIADLAHHLYQAGAAADPDKTVRYLTLAGDRAMEGAAFEEAFKAFERAWSMVPEPDKRGRAELLQRLGMVKRILGRVEEALDDLRAAMELYAEIGEADAVGALCSEAAQNLGWAARWEEAAEMVQCGLLALEERSSPDRASLLSWGGIILGWGGAYQAGKELLEEGLELARTLKDEGMVGLLMAGRASFSYAFSDLEGCLSDGVPAVELLRRSGNLWTAVEIQSFIVFSLALLGRYSEAEAVAEEATPVARRIGHFGALGLIGRGVSIGRFARSADLDEWDRFAEQDHDLYTAAGLPWASQSNTFKGMGLFWRGRWEEASEAVRLGVSGAPLGALVHWDAGISLVIDTYRGEEEEVLRLLDERRYALPNPGGPNHFGAWLLVVGAAEALWVLGRDDEAATMYPALTARPWNALYMSGGFRAWETSCAVAAAAGHNWVLAEQHFEKALRVAEELPIVTEQADARRLFAMMLLRRDSVGDRERARELLESARERYTTIGMPRHIEMTEALLKEL